MVTPLNDDKLLELWSEDSKMTAEWIEEGRRIYDLHAKYVDYWRREKRKIKVVERELRDLRLLKHQFYLDGPSPETQALGWVLPPRGKVLRQDLPLYMDADPQLQELTFKLEMLKQNVETLKAIIDSIASRHYTVQALSKVDMWRQGA